MNLSRPQLQETYRPFTLWRMAIEKLRQANFFLRHGDKARAWRAAGQVREFRALATRKQVVDTTSIPTCIELTCGTLSSADIRRLSGVTSSMQSELIAGVDTIVIRRIAKDTDPLPQKSTYISIIREYTVSTARALSNASKKCYEDTHRYPKRISCSQKIYDDAHLEHGCAEYLPLLEVKPKLTGGHIECEV